MASTAKERFFRMLNQRFAPDLFDLGFRGSGNVYYRLVSPRIDLITFQSSRMGDKCCLNLGVHYEFLPVPGGGLIPNAKTLREHHCEFRSRLHGADKEDLLWDYRPWHFMLGRIGDEISKKFMDEGIPYFEQFEPFPGVFTAITPAHLVSGSVPLDAFRPVPTGRIALTMARIMLHLGDTARAREFAEVGLQHVSPQSFAIKGELESLTASR